MSPSTKPRTAVDLAAVRARLATERGKRYWRSLEELADTEEFQAYLRAEFPEQAPQWLDPVGRRTILKLMGASLALAGLSACTRQPTERIFPYVKAPEEIVPGEPLFFATAVPLSGFAGGVLVESHMGRPTKVEGNPEHPSSLGATDAYAQASVLGLYDPDRSQVVRNIDEIRTWRAFADALAPLLAAQRQRRGAGLRLLTGRVTSPTLAQQIRDLLAAYPDAKWHQYEAVLHDGARAAAEIAFGRPLATQYRFDRADRVLALDADFLACGGGHLRAVREFMERRRRLDGGGGAMNRLYVVETTPTNTGSVADHRLPLGSGEIVEFALAVARGLGVPARAPQGMERHARWIDAAVRDLQEHRGGSVVLAGDWQPAGVHLLAHAMNDALGNAGQTVVYTEPVAAAPVDEMGSLRDLAAAMDAGTVELLVLIGVNPVYDAPVDFRFAERMARVGMRVHLGLYDDETAQLCHWHLPAAHDLESWSDARAHDGTVTILQPLIAPLYDGKTAHELFAALAGKPDRTSYEIVREYWQKQWPEEDFEARWRKAVHDGVVAGTAVPPLQPDWASRPAEWSADLFPPPPAPAPGASFEIVFRPDPSLYDGRFANNAWLQELPKAMTRLTWDNAALIAPAAAERLGVANEDVVELTVDGRSLRAPVWIAPGQAPDAVTVHLGYGRTRAGQIGTGTGFDANRLRTGARPWAAPGLAVRPTGERYPLACTQQHHSMEGRDLVRAATLAEFRAHPHFAQAHEPEHDTSMYPAFPYPGYAWAMAVDLGACVGCNACVVACMAENNVPVVGKDEVIRGREMHWLRIDRYYAGDLDNPETWHQPVMCMHCERAPCEVVCPVNATVHGNEGLNEMVYNRCVGTRYCSNNCPYKVRRFNFTLFSEPRSETLKMVYNPDVTVRSRGVMEKCTYCVQRVNAARIQAKREDRTIRDGEVVTACQAACPAGALVFGDHNDQTSRVAALRRDPRHYALLGELGTVPRTTYLAAVRNPNPALEETS